MNEIATPAQTGSELSLAAGVNTDMSVFGKIATSGRYLPYISLLAPNSDDAMEGKANAGTFLLKKGRGVAKELGKQFNCFLIDWRATAMDNNGRRPVTSHDPNSPLFQDCLANCENFGSGKMCGPEFLLYIPGHGFALYFMANKTAKNTAAVAIEHCRKAVTMTAQLIDDGTYKWFGCTVAPTSVPLEKPSQEEMDTVHKEFKEARGGVVEEEEKAPADTSARPQ